jgi:hypothetical protein
MRTRSKLVAVAMAAVSTATVVLVAPPARADQILLEGYPLLISGFVGVHSDVTTWSLGYRDEDPSGVCQWVKINIARHLRPDKQYRSEAMCSDGTGEVKWFDVSPPAGVKWSGTQGARIYRCYWDEVQQEEVCGGENVWVPER